LEEKRTYQAVPSKSYKEECAEAQAKLNLQLKQRATVKPIDTRKRLPEMPTRPPTTSLQEVGQGYGAECFESYKEKYKHEENLRFKDRPANLNLRRSESARIGLGRGYSERTKSNVQTQTLGRLSSYVPSRPDARVKEPRKTVTRGAAAAESNVTNRKPTETRQQTKNFEAYYKESLIQHKGAEDTVRFGNISGFKPKPVSELVLPENDFEKTARTQRRKAVPNQGSGEGLHHIHGRKHIRRDTKHGSNTSSVPYDQFGSY